MHGCKNTTEGESYMNKEVLIIQRHQQTIRAVESHSGHERLLFFKQIFLKFEIKFKC